MLKKIFSKIKKIYLILFFIINIIFLIALINVDKKYKSQEDFQNKLINQIESFKNDRVY